MKLFRLERHLGMLMVCWALVCAAAAAPAGGMSASVTVAVAPFTIDPQPFVGAPVRPDQGDFILSLTREATKQTEQTLVERHIVDSAGTVPSGEARTGRMVVTGTVRMPISLPPKVIGWNAAHRHGHFATATVTVTDAVGRLVSEENATVDWGDVWWFHGGKDAKNYPLDNVLASLARKAVDHAVRRLDLRHPGTVQTPDGGSR